MKYILKNTIIVDPTNPIQEPVDILIIDGLIENIGKSIPTSKNDQVIDLDGNIIAPGFIDMHVHLREPGYEYKETIESGCMAAAAGGFTAVCCMPNTNPVIDDESLVRGIIEKAKSVNGGIVDIYPIAAITKSREGKELSPMMELADAGAIAFSDDGSSVDNAEVLRRAMEYSTMVNKPIIQHAEDRELAKGGVMNEGFVSTTLGMPPIPSIAETVVLARDLLIAGLTGAKYHAAHISTRKSVELIRDAKRAGIFASCEVTPHHFTLTDEVVRSFDTNTKMSPPLRSHDDLLALKEGLRDGIIDVIATDHAPHSFDEKQVEYLFAPFGIVGLETAIALAITELVKTGYLSLVQLVEKYSINPRKILNLPPVMIKVGERANMTIINPDTKWIVYVDKFKSKSKNSPFNGRTLIGKAVGIFNNGKLLMH
ncbi:MAG: dihydroorotase [Ignavibacteriales bacterium]|nr:dihydroorotase [Ignavibacteriales bacterium]